jgi:alginate O-acetyltransferase complex protein AlgI
LSFLSLVFFLFFGFVFYTYWNLPERPIFRRVFLLLASCVFYGYFSVGFLIHFLIVIFINYSLYRFVFQRNYYLKLTVIFNLLNLFFFKYFYFFLGTLGGILGIPFLQEKVNIDMYVSGVLGILGFEIVLPMTISYYTFQLISLAVDTKSGKYPEKLSLLDFLSYLLFFPVLIAGPILRLDQIIPQFRTPREINPESMQSGLWLIIKGLIKKALLADSLLVLVIPIFSDPDKYSGVSLLLTTYFFGAMLYLDFSGLTDLARGLGLLLGFELPENFKAPFFMQSFGDFWRRWHLTFSYWIRDYIYIPLGGSRVGEIRIFFNFIITFALGGLWHGANMNYVLWGAINGFYIALERFMEQRKVNLPEFRGKFFVRYLLVLHLSMITWVLFFTPDFSTAFLVVSKILTNGAGMLPTGLETGVYALLFTFIFHLSAEYPEKFEPIRPLIKYLIPILGLILAIVLIQKSGSNIDFFYEKF